MKVILLLIFGTSAWTSAQLVGNFQPSFAQRNCDLAAPASCITPPLSNPNSSGGGYKSNPEAVK